jgi:hypothetical protein
MKDFTQAQLEADRPHIDAEDALDFCLGQLYADTEHRVGDDLVRGLTFEELIGALLVARDEVQAHAAWDARQA